MTSFEWWQRQVIEGSQGTKFLCMGCFEIFLIDQAWEDEDGEKWDVCAECGAPG